MSSDTALTELRRTTRLQHDRIDALLRLTEPMSLERYAAIVCGFDAFLRVWEPRLHAALPERLQGWFRPRRRGGFASADVEWLRSVAGIAPPAVDAAPARRLPLEDLADVMGSLYVIEGSALGGRVIAPRLRSTLKLGQGHGASYFHGFGGETGVMWSNFRVMAALEIGENPRSIVRACRSAGRTFDALTEMFGQLVGTPLPRLEPEPEPEPADADQAPPAEVAPALLQMFANEDPEGTLPMPLDPERRDRSATPPA